MDTGISGGGGGGGGGGGWGAETADPYLTALQAAIGSLTGQSGGSTSAWATDPQASINQFADYWASQGMDRNQVLSDLSPYLDSVDTPTSNASGGGSYSTLNTAAIDNTQKAISSLDDELDIGYSNIDESFDSLMGGYDADRNRTRADYDEGGVTNTNNLQRNKQNALVSGAQGLRGLRSVLASIGALSGDGSVLANRAVTNETNQDLGGATDTAATNARNLDKAWGRFDEEDEDRRREAETAKLNNRTALEGSIAGKRQSFYQKLAELFGEAGNTGEATNWLNKAGDLNSVIAQKSRVAATPFTTRSAVFSPGELENYLAGANDMTVRVAPTVGGGPGGPSTVLAGGQNRETEEERRRRLATA